MLRRSWQLYWATATVFILGALSLGLLIWIDQLSQRQRTHFAVANALMDLRFRATSSHLWLEEAIHGAERGDFDKAWSHLREAARLAQALEEGGETEYGLILPPAREPELRRGLEEIKQWLAEFTSVARERSGRPEVAAFDTELERRTDALFDALRENTGRLEAIVEGSAAADHGRSRRLIFGIILAWVIFVVAAATAVLGHERAQQRLDEVLRRAREELEAQVAERTRDLRVLTDSLRGELGERMKAEDAVKESETRLRQLSARLLTAQETERNRISTELHDELGHALIHVKFWIGTLKEGLKGAPSTVEESCEQLSAFIDQVIDDVRRLSRELSPSFLQDLGLSAALRGLGENYFRHHQTRVVSSTIDVDHLFPPKDQIVVYRILQEAFTNVAKHAQATCVSLTAERQGDALSFVVEDDGRGFDVKRVATRDAPDRGLGLATMAERAHMLDGSLGVWSEEGKGTRITLRIPVRNEEVA